MVSELKFLIINQFGENRKKYYNEIVFLAFKMSHYSPITSNFNDNQTYTWKKN